jgi:large subunit ribosomal protein L17
MRHARTGKKLGRDSAHRKALYANLTCSLLEHGRIRTTEAKAKAVKPFAEQMITLGRRGDLHARRQALSVLRSQEVVHKLFADVGPRMAERPGGYSRIVKPPSRRRRRDGLPRARRLRAVVPNFRPELQERCRGRR